MYHTCSWVGNYFYTKEKDITFYSLNKNLKYLIQIHLQTYSF